MNGTITTIHLCGELGEEFGKVFRLDIENVAEAIRAINHLKPGFSQRLVELSAKFKTRFRVKRDNEALTREQLLLPPGEHIAIIPIPEGRAGGAKGIITAILGVVLIIVGAILIETGFGAVLIGLGASLLLSGVASLLSPAPKQQKHDAPDNKPSYLLNGPVNNTQQGGPVPVMYGRPGPIGGVVISASIEAREFTPTATPTGNATSNRGPTTPAGALYNSAP